MPSVFSEILHFADCYILIVFAGVKYDTVVSDRNHVRLSRQQSRAQSCRELLCLVLVPSAVICVLGIVCSALVIHHVLAKVSNSLSTGVSACSLLYRHCKNSVYALCIPCIYSVWTLYEHCMKIV